MLEDYEKKQRLIDKYLNESLTSEELVSFNELVSKDEEFANDVDLQKQLSNHFNDNYSVIKNTANTNELNKYFRSDEAKNIKGVIEKVGNKHISKKTFKFPRTIAASLIGLFICVAGYLQFANNGLYQDYYTETDMPSLISRGINSNKLSNKIVTAYQNKNFKEAEILYQNFITDNEILNENVYIYGGMTYLELKQYDKSLIEFNKMTISNSIDNSKGLWFTAMVYLKNDNMQQLNETLNIITKNSENFNYTKAKKLLKELD